MFLEGIKSYCNCYFGDTVQMDYEKLVGTFFHKLTVPEEQRRFKAVARNVGKNNSRKEFYFQTIMGRGHKPNGFVVDGDPTFES